MNVVRVKTRDSIDGWVDIESWANPKTQIVDFVDDGGNSKPEYKDELEYSGVGEF